MSFVRLPMKVLVEPAEVQALREKFAAAQTTANHQAFWQAVQDSRNPIIEEHPDVPLYLRGSFDANGSPIDDDFVTAIG